MTLLLEVILPISIALLLVILFLIRINKLNAKHSIELGSKEVFFQQKTIEFEKKEATLTEKLNSTTNKLSDETTELEQLRVKYQEVSDRNTHQNAENIFLKEKIEEQNKEFKRLQKQATVEFENLANKILKKNTLDFSEVNQKNMHDLITPLKEKIQTFEKKVEDTYEKGLKDQTDLKAELKKLHELNHKISTEANNLTRALKGDVKQQGNWGEIVLE
ncbi:MAG: DNA recombination protein RmuC, partial [Prolixibacteraceae bacterium]|nr:DNA recombination protein RmuC [Prolixibacteraceae bacterium]